MKSLTKMTIQAALLSAGLIIFPSCSNEPKHEESKEHAEEMNEEKFNREGEKDADRMSEAYCGNLFEIKASENAATRATTADVKKLAAMISMAHMKMNTDLQALAGRKNITLPTDITDDQRKKLENMTEKSGLDYDKEYAKEMKDGHDDAEKLYQKLSDNAEDAEIKSWAASVLPEIRSHIDMVKATKEKLDDMKDNDNTIKGSHSEIHDGKDNLPGDRSDRKH